MSAYDPVATAKRAHAVHIDLMRGGQLAMKTRLRDDPHPSHTFLLAWIMSTETVLHLGDTPPETFIEMLRSWIETKKAYNNMQ